ncbi:predicted protein [Naegleria gruberi]|uniref:Predicted protein n=1 Tax=Naegleria gruberi TaxID=5762 RepID=D2VA39_NAEGR|nr:uncharacterized protein NAEGRDRAFT_65728 [Naegleria gruberi]EFC46242.1 predicted protein [Naegleria gruberi]|eukprot:XP_002678986.1 predicted protein [Naegleria gruberi strain NEG-M]
MSTAQSCNFSYKIPYFETPSEGSTHFNVGLCIGKQFKDQINEYLTRSDLPFQSIYLPYVLSKKDDQDESRRIEKEAQSTSSEGDHYALLRPWIQLVDEHFPKYVQEIRGLAAGSEQPFEWLFMLNMLNELRGKILHDERLKDKKTTKVGGCSEVFVCCKTSEMERALMAHNEDADKSMGEYSYIVKSNYLEENGSVVRSMVAYHYPGTIGGNTFGWNEYLVFGTNGKSPKKTLTESCGIPRCFINRYVYESKSIEEVHTRLEEYALLSSSGFSTNVSTRFIVKDDVNDFYQMANIELAPSLDGKEKQVSKYSIPIKRNNSDQPHYVHRRKSQAPGTDMQEQCVIPI